MPRTKAKLMLAGVAVRVVVAETTNWTAMICGLLDAPAAVIVMLLWYVPAVKSDGFTETLRKLGKVPDPGVTDSHGDPAVTA